MSYWNSDRAQAAFDIVSKSTDLDYAIQQIEAKVGRRVTRDSLQKVFRRNGLPAPTDALGTRAESQGSDKAETFARLVALIRKGPVDVARLCDRLDLSPKRLRALIARAQEQGVLVDVKNDHIGLSLPEPTDEPQDTEVAPVVGERQRIAVISDTHFGSKYCLREQIADFVRKAYARGIRDVLHPGDLLEGCYRHAEWEVTHPGFDAQCQDAFESLPQLPGLHYHLITGNHDETFANKIGINAGEAIARYFSENGRDDLTYYDTRSAFLNIRGAMIHLWHPKTGMAYARSYPLQKQIERYAAIKPQVLLVGHWHKFCHIYERNVHAIACPCFQGGEGSYGKSLGGSPAIGGLILSWHLTEAGTMREFAVEKHSYVEHETVYTPTNVMDAEMIAPVNRKPRAA